MRAIRKRHNDEIDEAFFKNADLRRDAVERAEERIRDKMERDQLSLTMQVITLQEQLAAAVK